jgi:DNA-binding winged helix-turn-helix (wHTH) protein
MFRFGPFELDEQALELRSDGEPIPLHLKPLRLLVYLLENRERRVSKEELFRWWDAVVSDAAISSAVKDIRHALRDDPAAPRWIQTRRGVGYQFVGKVEVHSPRTTSRTEAGYTACLVASHCRSLVGTRSCSGLSAL